MRSALTQFCLAQFYIQTQVLESLSLFLLAALTSASGSGMFITAAFGNKTRQILIFLFAPGQQSKAGQRAPLHTGFPCALIFLTKCPAYP